MSTTRLDRWLAPRLANRAADTAREIAADPTTVAVKRGNVVRPGTLVVRIVPASQVAERRGAASQAAAGAVVIVAAPGTDLQRGDLLQSEGSGIVYRVTYAPPGQEWRLECLGEVVE